MAFVALYAQTSSSNSSAPQKRVSHHANGSFDVKVTPQTLADPDADKSLGRMSIEKQYHGDLEAAAKGEMLTASTEVKGSGVYVAVERVTGMLQGRKGSFALHHTGVMTRGTPQLRITIVPDSGTDQLSGIEGAMNITIENDKHSYDFAYTLSERK
jgi:hypothetical protein